MNYSSKRRVTPKVVNGHIQRKNRRLASPSIRNNTTEELIVEKERPGRGYFHAVSKSDILALVEVIPHWEEISEGLKGVRLVPRREGFDAWYNFDGIISICAWERGLWRTVGEYYFQEHKALFDRLGLSYESTERGWLLKYTTDQVRRYQLLHVFLHELGHHFDLMTTRRKVEPGRGELFAENWAFEHESTVWEAYERLHGKL